MSSLFPFLSSLNSVSSSLSPISHCLHFFFWVQFTSIMWICVCVCVYDFWKGKMKIIDLKFVFGFWFWKGKCRFEICVCVCDCDCDCVWICVCVCVCVLIWFFLVGPRIEPNPLTGPGKKTHLVNRSGSGRVFLYPDPTRGPRPKARPRPVN